MAFSTILDSETDPDAPLTSSLAKRWTDNLLAVIDGDPTAPTFFGQSSVLVAKRVLSDQVNVSFTEFDSTKYDGYELRFHNVLYANAGSYLTLRTSANGGVSYEGGASSYNWVVDETAVVRSLTADNDDTSIILSDALPANQQGLSGVIRVMSPHLAGYTQVTANFTAGTTANVYMYQSAGARKSTENVNAVRFFFSDGVGNVDGNMTSGIITLHGIRNA